MPTVVCWETRVANGAAGIFSRCFFEAVSRGDDYSRAFEQAKHGVSVVTRAGQDGNGLPCQVPKYEFRDPDAPRAPPVPAPAPPPAAATTTAATSLASEESCAPPSAASPVASTRAQPMAAGVPLLLHRPAKWL